MAESGSPAKKTSPPVPTPSSGRLLLPVLAPPLPINDDEAKIQLELSPPGGGGGGGGGEGGGEGEVSSVGAERLARNASGSKSLGDNPGLPVSAPDPGLRLRQQFLGRGDHWAEDLRTSGEHLLGVDLSLRVSTANYDVAGSAVAFRSGEAEDYSQQQQDGSGGVGPMRRHRRGLSSSGEGSAGEFREEASAGARDRDSTVKIDPIEPPYPWASHLPCKVKSMAVLSQEQITRIWGDIRCKRCSLQNRVELALSDTYAQVRNALAQTDWKGRAPQNLLRPQLLDCPSCGRENMAQPNRYENKAFNNWLFMVLSQTLGICNIQELRFFCQRNGLHSSGAKGALLYTAYETILKQLEGSED